jgi:hypothetical protein
MLEGRVGVVKATTIGLDDQAGVAPEEVRLEPMTADAEWNVDLGRWKLSPAAHAKEDALQFTTGPPRFRMEFVENAAKPRNPAATAAAAKQSAQGGQIDDSQDLSLGKRLPQLPHRDDRGQIEQRPPNGSARNPAYGRPIARRQRVSMRIYAERMPASTIRRRHISRATIVSPNPPYGSCRAMRQDRAGARSQNGRQPASLLREQRVPHRIDALVHTVQATRSGALAGSILRNAQHTQLLERHKPKLTTSDPGNLTINPRPTGLKAKIWIALSPVGGGDGGHAGSVAELGARVARGGARNGGAMRAERERPGGCRASLKLHSPVEDEVTPKGRPTSCRPCPAYRRAYRPRQRLPSRGARR